MQHIHAETASAPVPTQKRPTPPARRVTAPAQDWEQWAASCCAMKLSEATSGSVVSVPAKAYGGYLHAVFSVVYGGRYEDYRAEAWQLVPAAMYQGDTWCHVSGDEFDDSLRERNDYSGMRVSVRGVELICAKPVHVIRELPTVPAVPAREAWEYDARERCQGWRALHFHNPSIAWKVLQGHPVVVYEDPLGTRPRMATLIWRHEDHLADYYLPDAVDVFALADLPSPGEAMEHAGQGVRTAPAEQTLLF